MSLTSLSRVPCRYRTGADLLLYCFAQLTICALEHLEAIAILFEQAQGRSRRVCLCFLRRCWLSASGLHSSCRRWRRETFGLIARGRWKICPYRKLSDKGRRHWYCDSCASLPGCGFDRNKQMQKRSYEPLAKFND